MAFFVIPLGFELRTSENSEYSKRLLALAIKYHSYPPKNMSEEDKARLAALRGR